ncbi:acyl-homoserine-lactone synthase [Vibrio scophthalmi]|uniref:acyl-homoserine-lactone synthase n=1 Tax=Vibrio scophthalmi TaxID=45658 RepID=UPI003AABE71F
MHYITGTALELNEATKLALYNYRYEVFIDNLKWDVIEGYGSDIERLEKDQFDTDETLYVIAREQESVVGCARLLPTSQPYLLKDVFPELLNGMQAPECDDVWELSRFTSFDCENKWQQTSTQFSAESTVILLRKTLEVAKSQGARALVSVSPLAVERLLRRENFSSRRLGPPIRVGGQLLIACWIDV